MPDQVSHLKSALAQVSDAVMMADAVGRINFMNPLAEQLTHCLAQAGGGRALREVLSIVDTDTGGDIDQAVEHARSFIGEGGARRRAILLGGADHPIIIEYSVSAVRDADGGCDGMVIVFRDIMHRRLSELALQTSQETQLAHDDALFVERERAQVTLTSIGDAVISTDFRGQITYLNPIAEAMTQWSQSAAVGLQIDEIFRLSDSSSRDPIAGPAMRAIIEDAIIRPGAPSVLIRKDHSEVAVEASASPIHDRRGGVVGAVVVAHDVTAAREQAERMARLALYDNLTGLPNRMLLTDRLAQALERAHRDSRCAGVLFIDLDRFKPVNDSQGHATGDRVLQEVAKRLLTCARSSDTVSRYGGDEFVIVLSDIAQPEDAAVCADKIIAALNAPFEVEGQVFTLGASVGIAHYPADAGAADTLVEYADLAMYHAKASGRDRYRFFSPELVPAEK